MAAPKPKRRTKPARRATAKRRPAPAGWQRNPWLLGGAAVGLVFLAGLGVGAYLNGHRPARVAVEHPAHREKPQQVATRAPAPPVPAPPAPVAEPTAPAAAPLTPVAVATLAPPPPPAATVVAPGGSDAPWIKNAVPFDLAKAKGPLIAIVIDDVGVDIKRSAKVIAMPAPVTLTILPYAREVAHQAQEARAAGHEILVHVPMEPMSSHADPGPSALLVRLGPDEILRRLRADLSAFSGYVGINNHEGSRFTSDAAAMRPVIDEVRRRGLMFLDSKTIASSVGWSIARAEHVPTISRDVFLDDTATLPAVERALADTERVARRQGYAIAIGHPKDPTIEALNAWFPEARARGFTLVPLTALVRLQMERLHPSG